MIWPGVCFLRFSENLRSLAARITTGSSSSPEEIREAVSYGVIKFNIDTDLQRAFWNGVRRSYQDKERYLQSRLGNSEGPDAPNQNSYDPCAWLRKAEESSKARLATAFEELQSVGVLAGARMWASASPSVGRMPKKRPPPRVANLSQTPRRCLNAKSCLRHGRLGRRTVRGARA